MELHTGMNLGEQGSMNDKDCALVLYDAQQ